MSYHRSSALRVYESVLSYELYIQMLRCSDLRGGVLNGSMHVGGFPGGLDGKSLSAVLETRVQSLGWEDSLEKEIATHSSILAWRILWSLVSYSPWGLKELDRTEQLTHTHTCTFGHSFLNISLALSITPNDYF